MAILRGGARRDFDVARPAKVSAGDFLHYSTAKKKNASDIYKRTCYNRTIWKGNVYFSDSQTQVTSAPLTLWLHHLLT